MRVAREQSIVVAVLISCLPFATGFGGASCTAHVRNPSYATYHFDQRYSLPPLDACANPTSSFLLPPFLQQLVPFLDM